MTALADNYFDLFQIPQGWDVDQAALDARFRELQQLLHPDRFAAADERERRMAAQRSATVNEAYKTLQSPLRRAAYLLQLAGVDTQRERSFHDGEFLMAQIQLREQLESIGEQSQPSDDALDQLYSDIATGLAERERIFQSALAEGDLEAAHIELSKMQFLHKLHSETEALEAQLFDD